jgi:hypothetical protein
MTDPLTVYSPKLLDEYQLVTLLRYTCWCSRWDMHDDSKYRSNTELHYIIRLSICRFSPKRLILQESDNLHQVDGFGGLVASGTQVRGFKPGRSRWIFTGVKHLSIPSSGGEVKESVPCLSFAACKRT